MIRSRYTIEAFLNANHGPRTQAVAINFIAERVEEIEAVNARQYIEGTGKINLTPILVACQKLATPDVSISSLREWWNTFLEWGDLPFVVTKLKAVMKKNAGISHGNRLLNPEQLHKLKLIVDADPNLYLDEIAKELGDSTGVYLCHGTLHKYITDKEHGLNYSLKKLSEVAKQRCYEHELIYLNTVKIYLNHPDLFITVDETHKDRNAARRRRGWLAKHAPGESTEWFRNCIRYTLIAAANINGFIPSACHIVERDVISEEGAAGTVDKDYFLYWVRKYLCPVLGNYANGEPNSVLLLDNASTHMQDEVVEAIEACGAVIIYGAPYSPHLNPIEKYFSVYKSYLKRNHRRIENDWRTVHHEALQQVDRNMGIKFFRHCKVPGADKIYTKEESDYIIGLCNIHTIIRYSQYYRR